MPAAAATAPLLAAAMAAGSWLFWAFSIWRAASSIFLLAASRPAVSMVTLPPGVFTEMAGASDPLNMAPVLGMNSELTAAMMTPTTMPATITTAV